MLKLKLLHERDDETLYTTRELRSNSCDFPFRLLVKVEYPRDWDSEAQALYGTYHVELLAVSPVAAKLVLDNACNNVGYSQENGHARNPNTNAVVYYEVLTEAHVYAKLWQSSGNNLKALLYEARKQANLANKSFGHYMNKPENACGDNGWKFIAGE